MSDEKVSTETIFSSLCLRGLEMKEIAGQHYFLDPQGILLLELALNIDAPHKIFHPSLSIHLPEKTFKVHTHQNLFPPK